MNQECFHKSLSHLPASFVREVLIILEKETIGKEKIGGNKQRLEKDDADNIEMQKAKKHDELKNKRRRIMESPTQSPSLPNSLDCPPEKTNKELSPSLAKNQQDIRPTESPIPNSSNSTPPSVRMNVFHLSLTYLFQLTFSLLSYPL